MKWITRQQVNVAAKKSHEAAVAMSKKHWFQLSTATKAEIIKADNEGIVDTHASYCALCQRYISKLDCKNCPIKENSVSCCVLWQKANRLYDPEDGNRWRHRAFQKAAKKMYERLCEL